MVIPHNCVSNCKYRLCTSVEHDDFCPAKIEETMLSFKLYSPPKYECPKCDYQGSSTIYFSFIDNNGNVIRTKDICPMCLCKKMEEVFGDSILKKII